MRTDKQDYLYINNISDETEYNYERIHLRYYIRGPRGGSYTLVMYIKDEVLEDKRVVIPIGHTELKGHGVFILKDNKLMPVEKVSRRGEGGIV